MCYALGQNGLVRKGNVHGDGQSGLGREDFDGVAQQGIVAVGGLDENFCLVQLCRAFFDVAERAAALFSFGGKIAAESEALAVEA